MKLDWQQQRCCIDNFAHNSMDVGSSVSSKMVCRHTPPSLAFLCCFCGVFSGWLCVMWSFRSYFCSLSGLYYVFLPALVYVGSVGLSCPVCPYVSEVTRIILRPRSAPKCGLQTCIGVAGSQASRPIPTPLQRRLPRLPPLPCQQLQLTRWCP